MKVCNDPVTVLSCNVVVGQGHNGQCNLILHLLLQINPQVFIDGTPGASYSSHLLFSPCALESSFVFYPPLCLGLNSLWLISPNIWCPTMF
jgi:hypothetical protein